MHQISELGAALDRARYRLLAADIGSVEFRDHAYALSVAGQRITESIADAYLELTAADPEAA
jgi:hypothetical protein